MFSKIWLINIFLTAMVVLVGFQAYRIWDGEEKKIPSINPAKKTSSPVYKEIVKKKKVAPANYETVAANNLFAEDRIERKPEEKPKGENEESDVKPVTDPKLLAFAEKEVKKIALYGVIISERGKKALVSNLEMKAPAAKTRKVSRSTMNFLQKALKNKKPATLVAASSGDKQKWVKQGDQIGPFKVMNINNDSILLSAEGKEFPISLYDKRGKKRAAPLKKETGPAIVSVGPGTKSVPTPIKTAPAPVKAPAAKQAAILKNIKKKLAPVPTRGRRPGRSTTPNRN